MTVSDGDDHTRKRACVRGDTEAASPTPGGSVDQDNTATACNMTSSRVARVRRPGCGPGAVSPLADLTNVSRIDDLGSVVTAAVDVGEWSDSDEDADENPCMPGGGGGGASAIASGDCTAMAGVSDGLSCLDGSLAIVLDDVTPFSRRGVVDGADGKQPTATTAHHDSCTTGVPGLRIQPLVRTTSFSVPSSVPLPSVSRLVTDCMDGRDGTVDIFAIATPKALPGTIPLSTPTPRPRAGARAPVLAAARPRYPVVAVKTPIADADKAPVADDHCALDVSSDSAASTVIGTLDHSHSDAEHDSNPCLVLARPPLAVPSSPGCRRAPTPRSSLKRDAATALRACEDSVATGANAALARVRLGLTQLLSPVLQRSGSGTAAVSCGVDDSMSFKAQSGVSGRTFVVECFRGVEAFAASFDSIATSSKQLALAGGVPPPPVVGCTVGCMPRL